MLLVGDGGDGLGGRTGRTNRADEQGGRKGRTNRADEKSGRKERTQRTRRKDRLDRRARCGAAGVRRGCVEGWGGPAGWCVCGVVVRLFRAQHPPGGGAGVFAIPNDPLTIDHDVRYSQGVLVGILERSRVCDGVRIERD